MLEDGQQGGVFVDPEEFGYLLGRREKLVGDTLQFEDVWVYNYSKHNVNDIKIGNLH